MLESSLSHSAAHSLKAWNEEFRLKIWYKMSWCNFKEIDFDYWGPEGGGGGVLVENFSKTVSPVSRTSKGTLINPITQRRNAKDFYETDYLR